MRMKIFWLVPLLIFASCTEAPDERDMVETPLFRGLRMIDERTIDWTKNSFGVSSGGTGKVGTLSFFGRKHFDEAKESMPCWLEITVKSPAEVPVDGTAKLSIPKPPPEGANEGPWDTIFDNKPPDHWSITRTTIGGGESNTAASKIAAAVFTEMAKTDEAKVHNGAVDDCHKPG